MSRIGKQPVIVPSGVEVTLNGSDVTVKGKRGQLQRTFPEVITIERAEDTLVLKRPDDSRQSRSLHGLSRSLLQNMITGVSEGFSRTLVISGVGYRCAPKGKSLEFSLGYSHPIIIDPPEGISFESQQTEVTVKGVDKQVVGQVAASIRMLRKPEPYKGKGIRYSDERIIRKAGKAAAK